MDSSFVVTGKGHMPVRPTYASYLVRLWRESNTEPAEMTADWQGELQHIQSDQRWSFSTVDELLGLLRQQVEDPDGSGRLADGEWLKNV
jgi:hypothetical protein